MNFRESESYLLSLGNEVSAMKLGLDNIRTLLTELNNPQNEYKKVQIAGTNGKGSVCAFLDSICVSAGIKAGVYTSPHLISMTERIKFGGIEISEADFANYAQLVRKTAERLVRSGHLDYTPTFFEQVTAIALYSFADKNVELAILETGLGGRFDATTAANAEIVAITRIAVDHQEYLGRTLAEIAGEKAAVIHTGAKAVIGPQSDIADAVLIERCREVGVEPIRAAPNVANPYQLGLRGSHQVENAAVAIETAKVLMDENYPVSYLDITNGLLSAVHPGRLEWHGNVLLDGAHNLSGAKALRAFLNEIEDRPVTIVFGVMKDKEPAEMAAELFPNARRVILTRPENSRSMTVDELAAQIPAEFEEKVMGSENAADALRIAREHSGESDVILITGSLYLVGEVKKILNNERYA